MTKEKINGDYLDRMRRKHEYKRAPPQGDILVALTGASKATSIGEAIRLKLDPYIRTFDDNVITDLFNFDGYTGLIMCHGYTYMDWIENVPDEQTEQIIDVNLTGSIKLVKQFVNDTIKMPYRKKIISIGSMAYRSVLNGSAAYCASKAGLNMFIRCAAWELAPKGYDVYIIHPSNVLDTPMTEDTIKGLMRYRKISEKAARNYWAEGDIRSSPLTKDEIVQHIEYLLFYDNDYLSGCPIELAGGMR